MTLDRLARFLKWLLADRCGATWWLRGHDRLLHFEHRRVALKCVSCGQETPGIVIDTPAPVVTVKGDARRHRIQRVRLAARRIA